MYIEAESADDAVVKVQNACDRSWVMNLTVSFPMEISIEPAGTLKAHRADAERWQEKVPPADFFFNHGQFMHAHGDPLKYLINELQVKGTSNRALISLVNSEPIFDSGDGPLPSFMLVQVGLTSSSKELLFVSAYYRALETTAFLPLNVAELTLIAERIANSIPEIKRAQVTMHAFRAHAQPGFRALKRSGLDMASGPEISDLVSSGNVTELSRLLKDKSAPATIIETSGLTSLQQEVALAGWSAALVDQLDLAIGTLTRLKTLRSGGSHADRIEETQRQLTDRLYKAADMVTKEKIAGAR